MTTRLEFIQRAQIRIGDEPIGAETDVGADTYVAIFDAVRDDLLSRYPWTFATVVRRLTRLAAVPEAHWKYYYQLPSEMLGAPRAVFDDATRRQPISRYELSENRLSTDAENIWLNYTKRADPTFWPGYFGELLNVAIMAELAMSVREDHVMYDRLRQVAFGTTAQMGEGGLLAQAKNMDAQSHSSAVVVEGSSPLIDVRYSGGYKEFI